MTFTNEITLNTIVDFEYFLDDYILGSREFRTAGDIWRAAEMLEESTGESFYTDAVQYGISKGWLED